MGYDIAIIMEKSLTSHCLFLRSSYHEYNFKRYDQRSTLISKGSSTQGAIMKGCTYGNPEKRGLVSEKERFRIPITRNLLFSFHLVSKSEQEQPSRQGYRPLSGRASILDSSVAASHSLQEECLPSS